MKHRVVKFKTDEDGAKVIKDSWHLVVLRAGSPMKLCTGEFFGFGEGNATFDEKEGKITCADCISEINFFKSIRL